MTWYSKLFLLSVMLSLVSIPVHCQRFRSNNSQSGGTNTVAAIVSPVIGLVAWFLVCIGCGVYCHTRRKRQLQTAAPRAFIRNNNAGYPTAQQQTPTVLYNTGYSHPPTYYYGNAGTANNGQQLFQPLYYMVVNDQTTTGSSGVGASAQQATRYKSVDKSFEYTIATPALYLSDP